jgi:hypothetical protein
MKIVKFWLHSYSDETIIAVIDEDKKDELVAKVVNQLDRMYDVSNIEHKGDNVLITWTDGDRCTSTIEFQEIELNDLDSIKVV